MVESSNKVVPLNARTGGGAAADESHLFARIPAPFIEMKDKGKQGLQSLLQSLFDNIDDALFELADRAANNIEQNLYFESMREIRIKRRGMELGFGRELDEAFRQLLAGSVPTLSDKAGTQDAISADNLTLVEEDELEELVAADSMIAKAERQFAVPLRQLNTRLDSMVDNQAVSDRNNPFGPAVVCRSFIKVCGSLALDIKAKLVLFKLFDRYVMNDLGKVYALSNQVLIENGVLPKLTQRQQGQAQAAAEAANPLDSYNADGSSSGGDVFSDLQALLHSLPQQHTEVTQGLAAPGLAPQIPRDTLLQLLQVVQQSMMSRLEQQQQQAFNGVTPQQLDIQRSLSSLLARKMPSRAMSIGQVDDDAINLVAMLFQFILDDRNLAAPMKALIARLQIPLIKVAMLDKNFFSKGGHPARKLLNEIANASLGWIPGSNIDRDPLYNKVSEIVNRLLNEFEGDTGIFHEVLADFVAFIEVDKRRTSLVEQRTVNAEDGKAKSEIARNKVQALLNEKVAGKSLPKVVITLLEEAWSNVMFLICLKDGEDSKNWQDAVRVVDELLWSVEPMQSTETRQRLLKLVPNLLKNLRAGLTKIGYNPFDMNKLFADLEAIHLTQLKDLSTVTLDMPAESRPTRSPADKVAQTRAIEKTLDQMLEGRDVGDVSIEQLDAELDQQLAEFDALADLVEQSASDEPAAAAVAEDSPLARQVVEKLQISGVREPEPEPAAPVVELEENDPCLGKVDALNMGNWVELHQEDGKKFRCRLAAIIRGTGKYIFVNRSGMKIAEYDREALARDIKQGRVSTLDEGLLFDRALESVIGNLRKMKSGPA